MGRIDDERLAALNRDLDEPVAPGEMAAVLGALDAYLAPEPPPGSTAALVERLRAFVPPAPPVRRFRADGLSASPFRLLLGNLTAQVRLLRPAWWIVTALVTLAWLGVGELTPVAPWLLAPLLGAAGVAHAFRGAGSPAMEIECSCAVRPGHVISARMLLVLGWVALLGAASAGALALLGHELALWSALAAWVSGALLFGGAALLLTIWAGRWGGLGLGLVLWAGLTAWRHAEALTRTVPVPAWVMSDGAAAAAGAAMIGLALVLAGRSYRLPRGEE